MKNGIERRRYIRAPLKLDLFIETPKGRINGMTADISIRGLSIMLFLKAPEIDQKFEIMLKSPYGHEMSITCEKAWSGKHISNKIVYDAIGVHFTHISLSDQKILTTMIEDHYLVLAFKESITLDDDNKL